MPWMRARLDLAGAVVATVFLCLSFTPSLLPRSWIVQGILSGLTAVTGYAVGFLLGCLLHRAPPVRRWAVWTFAAAAVVALPLCLYQGWRWQSEVAGLIGVAAPPAASWLGVLPLAGVIFAALLLAQRGVRRLGRVVRQERRYQGGLAGVLVALALTHGGAWSLSGMSGDLSTTLDGRVSGVAAPTAPTRSGSPASYVSWASLGRQGRAFVTSPGTRPIRVYVGLRSAPTAEDRARLAVAELERTGAFQRRVLCLVVPTGSGWVDEPTVRALEDEYDGNTALAVVQYSALPSWLSLVTDPEQARAASVALLDEVHRRWSAMPAATRPKLLIYGHSLGALGAQAPFEDGSPLSEVDGAVFTGPPDTSELWRVLVADRDRGSTQVTPRLAHHPEVRFANRAGDLAPPGRPRVVFLQHPTDPVVWWSPDLILRKPDWLREPRTDPILRKVHWYPFVTFWQLSADMLAALDVPAGYGHRYGAEARSTWALLTGESPGGPAVIRR
jgi:uncharacterized membrane protein